ncbi:hypothetical protein ES703_115073 [subsurface metagenome]
MSWDLKDIPNFSISDLLSRFISNAKICSFLIPKLSNTFTKIPGPTQGSKILSFLPIGPNLDIIYSTVLGGVNTTPNSLLLGKIIYQHSLVCSLIIITHTSYLFFFNHSTIKLSTRVKIF